MGEHFEGQRLQGVAAEDRCRLVKSAVAGGPSPSQIVVIHSWQVVMDERIGMDHLNCHGGRGRGEPGLGFGHLGSTGPRRPEHKRRSEPLARGQKGMTQGGDESRRGVVGERERLGQERIDELRHPSQAFGHTIRDIGDRGRWSAGLRAACHAGTLRE